MDIRANTALYIRAIDGRFSILHKVEEEEIDARFNSGSKMEFLSERFEIKIRMFLKVIFPRKWEEGGRERLAGKVGATSRGSSFRSPARPSLPNLTSFASFSPLGYS